MMFRDRKMSPWKMAAYLMVLGVGGMGGCDILGVGGWLRGCDIQMMARHVANLTLVTLKRGLNIGVI